MVLVTISEESSQITYPSLASSVSVWNLVTAFLRDFPSPDSVGIFALLDLRETALRELRHYPLKRHTTLNTETVNVKDYRDR